MTTPSHTHAVSDSSIWIFGFGTLYLSKTEANKDKDQVVREYIKQYEFFGKTYYIRQSAHSIKTVKAMGYCPIN